jgi:hypothetical protein
MRFALYDFEVQAQKEWKVIIDKKAEYKSGMVAFKPTPNPNESLDLIWEDLTKHKEKSPDVETFMEQYFSNMKKNPDIKSFEPIKGEVIKRGEHSYLPHEFTYEFKRYMRRGFNQKIIGMTMYDLHSNRFAIFYAKIDLEKGQTNEAMLREGINSLNCTCEIGSSKS